MRFIVVWIYFAWCNATDRLAGIVRWPANLYAKLCRLFLRHLPLGISVWLIRSAHCLPFVGRGLKARAQVAQANRKSLMGSGERMDYVALSLEHKLLELAATWGQNKQILADVERCRERLNRIVEPLHKAGIPVILAPLHMVSDVLAGMVGAGIAPGKTTVVVSSGAQQYSPEMRRFHGIDLDYCSIHDNSRDIATGLTGALLQAAENKRNIMVFPDITPDYTVHANRAATAKFACQLFARPAGLHSGIVRMAKVSGARVVCYYLYRDSGLKIKIYEPVDARGLKASLPKIIESSIRRHPDDWRLWHAHSLYFINE